MREKGISKEETQQNIIKAVGRGFRKNGYAGIGVDGLAKLAGVTSGAFYSHLSSKDKAFKVALEKGLDEVIEAIPKFQEEHKSEWPKAFAEYYLSKNHQKDLECGCAMASLTTEVIRFDEHVHKLYEDKMLKIASLIADSIKHGNEEERFEKSWSFLSILIGGLNIVRALDKEKIKGQISKHIIESALKIFDQ